MTFIKIFAISFVGDDLRKIIRDVQIHHILDNKKDRHYVSIESLSVQQLRDELTNRQLSKKGKKPELVARLKDAVGNNTKVYLQKLKFTE